MHATFLVLLVPFLSRHLLLSCDLFTVIHVIVIGGRTYSLVKSPQ